MLVPAPHWVRRLRSNAVPSALNIARINLLCCTVVGVLQVSYTEQCTLAGATAIVLPTQAEDNFLLKPEDLAAAITSKTRMIILCNPSCVFDTAVAALVS